MGRIRNMDNIVLILSIHILGQNMALLNFIDNPIRKNNSMKKKYLLAPVPTSVPEHVSLEMALPHATSTNSSVQQDIW